MEINSSWAKNAMVCGSSQGIGASTALELSKKGVSITLVARNEKKLNKILLELDMSFNQSHDYIVADFDSPIDLEKKVKNYLYEKHKKFHFLINNSGGPKPGKILDSKTTDFINAFNRHLICNHLLTKLLIGDMKQMRFGRIINIISTSVKQPIKGLGVSNTIRAAVANWAKTLSFEVGLEGVTVNNILPGFTNTQRLQNIFKNKAQSSGDDIESIIVQAQSEIPIGRFADPSEVAKIIVFLCSKDAAYINGTSIPVDGGRLGSM